MGEYPKHRLGRLLLASFIFVGLFLSGVLMPAGVREAFAAGETFTWTDTGGAVSDFGIYSLAWDGTGLYAGTHGHGLWRYDPAVNKWTEIPGVEGKDVTSLAWSGNRLYAILWENIETRINPDAYKGVWSYDPRPVVGRI